MFAFDLTQLEVHFQNGTSQVLTFLGSIFPTINLHITFEVQ